jgi:hypothetical protein
MMMNELQFCSTFKDKRLNIHTSTSEYEKVHIERIELASNVNSQTSDNLPSAIVVNGTIIRIINIERIEVL